MAAMASPVAAQSPELDAGRGAELSIWVRWYSGMQTPCRASCSEVNCFEAGDDVTA